VRSGKGARGIGSKGKDAAQAREQCGVTTGTWYEGVALRQRTARPVGARSGVGMPTTGSDEIPWAARRVADDERGDTSLRVADVLQARRSPWRPTPPTAPDRREVVKRLRSDWGRRGQRHPFAREAKAGGGFRVFSRPRLGRRSTLGSSRDSPSAWLDERPARAQSRPRIRRGLPDEGELDRNASPTSRRRTNAGRTDPREEDREAPARGGGERDGGRPACINH